MDGERPGKCPHCPAEYSTAQEMTVHLSNVGYHVRERLESAERVVAAARGWMNASTATVSRYRRIHLESAVEEHERTWPRAPSVP